MNEFNQIEMLVQCFDVEIKKLSIDEARKEPCLLTDDGKQLIGLATLCKYLVANSKYKDDFLELSLNPFTGNSIEDSILNQWLEFRTTRINNCANSLDMEITLKILNTYLEDKVYFVGHRISLVDILLYYGLHSFLQKLSFEEKETYVNFSRWFNLVQHNDRIRQRLSEIKFSKTPLYSGARSH